MAMTRSIPSNLSTRSWLMLCLFSSAVAWSESRFFDNTALYDHMTGTHINCHLCPEENQHR